MKCDELSRISRNLEENIKRGKTCEKEEKKKHKEKIKGTRRMKILKLILA